MKKLFNLLLLIAFICPSVNAQDLQPKGLMQSSLVADFNAYFMAIEDQDFDLALEFVLPSLFDLIPRDFMQESMETEANDGEKSLQVIDAKIKPVKGIIEDEMNFYALVHYSYTLVVQAAEDDWGGMDDEDGDWGGSELDIDTYRQKYGASNVTYDQENKRIRIKQQGKLIAVQSKDEFEDDGWKFVEVKKDMQDMVAQLIPGSIMSRLGS